MRRRSVHMRVDPEFVRYINENMQNTNPAMDYPTATWLITRKLKKGINLTTDSIL